MYHPAGSDAGTRRTRGSVTAAQTHNPTARSVGVAPCYSKSGHRLLTVDDLANWLGVTPRWVYAEASADRLPHVKVGRFYRFKPESIEEWLTANERGTV